MALILNLLIWTFGAVALSFGISIFIRENRSLLNNKLFLVLCIADCCWATSYAVMTTEYSVTTEVRYIARAFMLAGIIVNIIICLLLLMFWQEVHKWMRRGITLVCVIIGAIILPLIADPDTVEFTESAYGWTYTHNYTTGRILYTFYLIGVLLILLGLICYGYTKAKKKRIRFITNCAVLWFCSIAIGTSFDTWAQIFQKPVFPGSIFAMFINLCSIYFIILNVKVSHLTVNSVTEYIFTSLDTPILIMEENGNIVDANDVALSFLQENKEGLAVQKLEDLFAFDLNSMEATESNTTGQVSFHLNAECRVNRAHCKITLTRVSNRFDEHLGDIALITDMTNQIHLIEELTASKELAENASRAKSAFLANMSHEMRTPLNVIIGMSHIIMQEDINPRVREEIAGISLAGKGLHSTINDILDLSKIESGRYELIPVAYSLSKLVYDIVRVMRIQTFGKEVHFYANIEPGIPDELIGDDIRLKQVLVNLLTNAVKYTEEGYISLQVKGRFGNQEEGVLIFEISDTGIGIRDEDMKKLFEIFSRVDTRKNRQLAGTGLGLSITKKICTLMEGDVLVDSVYGQGSMFTATMLQRVKNSKSVNLYRVEDKKPLLFYRIGHEFLSMYENSLEEMNIQFEHTNAIPSLEKADLYSYLVVRYDQYKEERAQIDKVFKPDHIVILSDGDTKMEGIGYEGEMKTVCTPLFPIQIAYVLNHNKVMVELDQDDFDQNNIVPLPDAKILVVDDSITNLRVANGLMRPYRMQVETATSGKEALSMIQNKVYDLIFMDHMMPDMDGIDTVHEIRKLQGNYYKTLPVVALTANAIEGNRELFLENSFCDFLSKPISQKELDRILHQYIVQ